MISVTKGHYMAIRQYSAHKKFLFASVAAALLISGPVVASGDAAKGEKFAKKRCGACHSFEKGGKHKVGPNLFGVTRRGPAKADGYSYSKHLSKAAAEGFSWNAEELDLYLTDPTKFLRKKTGNKKARSKMVFKLKKKKDRQNVIAYLESLK